MHLGIYGIWLVRYCAFIGLFSLYFRVDGSPHLAQQNGLGKYLVAGNEEPRPLPSFPCVLIPHLKFPFYP